MSGERFTLTEEHVTLLRHAYVCWNGDEFGAPTIDPKRPYGNSSGEMDVARVLGEPIDPDDWDYGFDEADYERLRRLHGETEVALQIVLATGTFRPGIYRKRDKYDHRSWEADALQHQGGKP